MPSSTSLFEELGADILARMFDVAAHGLALVDEGRRFVHLNAEGCNILGLPYEELVGGDVLSRVVPDARERAASWIEASLAGRPHKQDFALARPDLRTRVASFFCVPVTLQARRAGLVAFHDVTTARRAESESRALADISQILAREVSVNAISRRLAEQVVLATPAVASAVILLSPESTRGRVAGAAGLPDGFAQVLESSFLTDPSALAKRMPEPGETRVVTDLQALYRDHPVGASLAPEPSRTEADTLVCVPLTYLGERTGALFTYFAPAYAPTEPDLDFLRKIADQSVFAVENARLMAAVQDKAALEERQRLARELHDSVSQALYGIALGTRSAKSQLGRSTARVSERLDYVMKMAEAAMGEMRALIFELRPETLATEGLVMAVAKQASAMQARHGLEVRSELGDEPPLSFTAKQALFRIVQEAFHNIVKHARARSASVVLSEEAQRVVLMVRDDGVGFDTDASYPGHFGLSSMRERAEGLGGTFRIVSAPHEGTELRVELPLEPPSSDATD